MKKFEKKYCYKKKCFEVDKNLPKSSLDALNSNKRIKVVSVSGGYESPTHINFDMGLKNDVHKAEKYLKKMIPNSRIDCYTWSEGRGKSSKSGKSCNVVSKKKKSCPWFKHAAKVLSELK